MRYTFRWFLLGLTILCTLAAASQTMPRISGDFRNMRVDRFVDSLQSLSGYRFYYPDHMLDTLEIDVQLHDQRLDSTLSAAFAHSPIQWAIDPWKRVFLTSGYPIQTNLYLAAAEMPASEDSIRAANFSNRAGLQGGAYADNKLYELGHKRSLKTPVPATISGFVRDEKTGEPIVAATVSADNDSKRVLTDPSGYFTIQLPTGRHELMVTYTGMYDARRRIILYEDAKFNVELKSEVSSLKLVVVTAAKSSNVAKNEMGVQRLNIRTIRQVPAILGETDVLRVVLALPGVTSVGEGTTGFNVRGGATDQNLVRFAGSTIYNPAHFFGFFSAFHPDVVKDVELYKASIPEKFGGRLASVLDISSRDGNKKKFAGSAGIGPLTSKISLEGPIDSGKTSFLLGARTTYSDWLLKQLKDKSYSRSSAAFYDVDLHIAHEMNTRNALSLNAYYSRDKFRLASDTLYEYSNKNANVQWKHIFHSKFFGNFTLAYDNYGFSTSSDAVPVNAYKYQFTINQYSARGDMEYTLNDRHALNFGLQSTLYQLDPGKIDPDDSRSLVIPDKLDRQKALETALYFGDHINVNRTLSVNAGVRYSIYNYLGPQRIYTYGQGAPREVNTIRDSMSYGNSAIIKTYQAPEIRLTARQLLGSKSSIKISFNTLQQYIHTLSNTTAASPTDIWKLSDPYIRPTRGEQYSIGLYRNVKHNTVELSLEAYYKNLRNAVDYKGGANLVMNHHIETDVVNARGYAYGVEFLLRKTAGKLNGWIGYAYSRTFLKTDDPLAAIPTNGGRYYPADYDKPHNLNAIMNFRFSQRYSVSLNVIYSTGRPITLPVAEFSLGGAVRAFYTDRNQYRIPDYFRSDFSLNIDGNHKVKQRIHNSWTAGVYNLTGRENPYSIYFTSQNGVLNGYQLSIFGTAIPYVTYNFRF